MSLEQKSWRRWARLKPAAAAGVAMLVLALLYARPSIVALRQLPGLPDLGEKARLLAAEVKAKDKAARTFPVRGDNIGMLGKLYQANAFVKEAERCYLAASRLSAGNPRWPYYLSFIKQQMGDAGGAKFWLEKAILRAPDYAPARLKLADLGFKSGKAEEASAVYRRIQDDPAVGPHACLGLARIAMGQGRWEEARAALEKALGLDPQFKPAYRLLAVVQEHFGRKEDAEILRERAGLERYSEAADPWVEELSGLCLDPRELMRQANIAFQTNRYERAFELYRRALDFEPDNLENILGIAVMVFDSGNREAARPLFLKALTLRPGDEMALYHLAMIDLLAGRPDDARLTFEKLVAVNPRSVDGWTGLGDLAFREGDLPGAEGHYRKALAIDPRAPKGHYGLGKAATARGRWPAALASFTRASELDARSADTWFSLGAVQARLGRLDEAISSYRKALGENPEFALAHYNLANALSRQGKLTEAGRRYERAIACEPDLAEAHLNLGALLGREGEPGAREHLETALSLARAQGKAELEKDIRAELDRLPALR